jgi:hypothetical protein|tara:strand:+ start:8084 stop:8476 length:393 start_codon:yes stop_codon:yes gene_type:complete
MADIISVQTIADVSGVKHVSKMTNLSDGTGESLVTKIDASNTNAMTEDATKVLARIWYSVNTTNSNAAVELLWAGTTNATMVFLSGTGHWDLRTFGDGISNNATTSTGDVLLSTRNFVSGDNYTILAEFR